MLRFLVLILSILIFNSSYSQHKNHKIRILLLSQPARYSSSLLALNQLWYKEYPKSSFHFVNDNNEWMKMDKLGHAVTSYNMGVAGIDAYRWAGYNDVVSTFIGGYLTALLFNLWGVNMLMSTPAHVHLLIGGFAFGAVFMATDPVTGSQTNKGKIIYGLLIGFFAIVIRVFNPAYPEGMMLAILFMNVFAPLIDHYIIQSNIKKRINRLKK